MSGENIWKGKIDYLIKNRYLRKEDSIIEVGAGDDSSFDYMRSLGFKKITTTDISFLSKRKLDIINDTIPKCDVIFGIGVLHHVRDARKALNNVKKSCKKYFFIEPYMKNPYQLLVSFLPSEWCRFRYIIKEPDGEKISFMNAIGMRVIQRLVKGNGDLHEAKK